MNLGELGDLLENSTNILRVETLSRYTSASDRDWVAAYLHGEQKPDVEAKREWLDILSGHAAAGHPVRRVRVVQRPVSDYVRYSCEWSYVDNAAAGEQVRVLDEDDDDPDAADLAHLVGDFYVADDRVITMRYDADGAFVSAEVVADRAGRMRAQAERAFARGRDFTEWWAANPQLHRSLVAH